MKERSFSASRNLSLSALAFPPVILLHQLTTYLLPLRLLHSKLSLLI